jgi:transposase InsO family protein
LTRDIIALVWEYGRFGYRRITAPLRDAGWLVNKKRVEWRLSANNVIDVLSNLIILHGVPAHIGSDNGPEFVAKTVQAWVTGIGAQTSYITAGSPWGEVVQKSSQWGDFWPNGYIDGFNARLRDKFLNEEIFYTLQEAKI